MTSSYPPCLLGARLWREDGKLQAAEGWEGALRKEAEVPALFQTPQASAADRCGDTLLCWTSPGFDMGRGDLPPASGLNSECC